MIRFRSYIRKGFLSLSVAIVTIAPLVTLSSASAASDTGCTPPPASSYGSGTHSPTGSSAPAFIYQCPDAQNTDKQYVGDWVSAHYVYYPQANQTEPLEPVTYIYDNATGQYDYTIWQYQASHNTYVQQDLSTPTPPDPGPYVNIVGGPPAPVSSDPTSGDTSPDAQANATAASNGTNNTIDNTANNTANDTNTNSVGVNNTIGAVATSGNATLMDNAVAGNATSGDVVDQANVINMLQSSSNALGAGSNVATFTYNIDGDVNGDLLFDPSLIGALQGSTDITNTTDNTLNINNTSDASITNNLTLNADSGNATVKENGQAGNATSGSAKAIANLVNSIESSISAGKSFIGTININGNLNGDILIPTNFANDLIADNVPTVSVDAPSSLNSTTTNKTTTTNTSNQNISNTVHSNASTGSAQVADDAVGGSATSGNASTKVTAFNLTGSHIVANNDIFVFVNVMGTWTGLIVNAPFGATAAELGGGVTENDTTTNTANVTNTSNQTITNNVNVNAKSGNAGVTDNAVGGNATSGDAQTATNLLNIENSTISTTNWFGILFINVFGTWNGSFGVNTSAGNAAITSNTLPHTTYFVASSHFVKTAAAPTTTYTVPTTTTTTAPASPSGNVLSAKTVKVASVDPTPQLQASNSQYKTFLVIGVLVVLYIVSDATISRRHRHHLKV